MKPPAHKPSAPAREAHALATYAPVAPAIDFIGTIETVDPVAISTPARRAEGGKPVPAQTERRYYNGELIETMILPSTSIRGRLRHTATRMVMQHHVETAKASFKVADYLLTAPGGVVDAAGIKRTAASADDAADGQGEISKDGAVDLDQQQALRQRNPVVSLFGSMESSITSKLHVRSAIPIEPLPPGSAVIGAGSRANPLNRDPEIFSSGAALFQPVDVHAFIAANKTKVEANKIDGEADRLEREVCGKRKAGDKAGADALDAEAKALRAKAKAMSESVGGKVNLQQPLGG